MIPPVVGPGRVVPQCVLAAKLFGDRVENFLDLAAASDKAFGQQEGPPAAIFRECVQNIHVDLITFVLETCFPCEQGRNRPAPGIAIGTFRECERGNADRIDEQV